MSRELEAQVGSEVYLHERLGRNGEEVSVYRVRVLSFENIMGLNINHSVGQKYSLRVLEVIREIKRDTLNDKCEIGSVIEVFKTNDSFPRDGWHFTSQYSNSA